MMLEPILDRSKPAYWIDNADSWICSWCGYETNYLKPVCPHCGVDMTGKEEPGNDVEGNAKES